jgi:peptide/nickel transport system substrate-binding protein
VNHSRELTRRQALGLLGAGVAAALLAACGGTAAPASPSASSAAAASGAAAAKPSAGGASAQPKSGGTLKIGRVGDLTNLEPHRLNPAGFSINFLMYDRLTQYDDKLQPQPMLAESWDLSSDAKQLKLNVRKGVQFHGGREFTSDDVMYNLKRAADPKTGTGQFAQQAGVFTDIQTPDKYTVMLKMDQPQPGVWDLFEQLNMGDKELLSNADAAKSKTSGTGPFTFGEWVTGDHVTLNKNKSYWQSGKPYVDSVVTQIYKDPQSMVIAFEAGGQDMIDTPPTRDTARFQKDSKYKVVLDPISVIYDFEFNTTIPPLDNPKVRQALNYAIDRQRMADSLQGLGQAMDLPWAPTSPAYEADKNTHYTFDLDKAKAMLAEAGAGNIELDFMSTPSDGDVLPMGQIYQSDLAKIGVKLNFMTLDNAAYQEQLLGHKYKGVAGYRTNNTNLAPANMLLRNGGWKIEGGNHTGYTNADYTRLVKALSIEPDAAKAKQISSQINDLLLDAAAMNTVTVIRFGLVTQSKVSGVRRGAGLQLVLTDASLS